MATITTLRTGYVDHYLHRASADTRPWTATEVEVHVQAAMDALWRDNIGLRMSGDVTTDPTTNTYTLPTSMVRIRRIDLLDANSMYIDRLRDFRVVWDDDTPTTFVVTPALASGYTMRVLGYKAMARTGADLPTELEAPVAASAAARAYATLGGELLNSKRQANEDTGRTVSYQDALQNRDYWMASYRQDIERSSYQMRTGPVGAYR